MFQAIGKKQPKKSGLQQDSNPWPPPIPVNWSWLSYEATHGEQTCDKTKKKQNKTNLCDNKRKRKKKQSTVRPMSYV